MALERQSLLAVAKELEKLIAAVRVVGIRPMRLEQWVGRLRPIRDELVWTRPEIRRLRSKLGRAVHNMERRRASPKHLQNLQDALDVVQALVKMSGREEIPTEIAIGKHRVTNVWGYSARELMPVVRKVRDISQRLEDYGFDKLGEIEVVVNPDAVTNGYAAYAPDEDVIYLNPERAGNANKELLGAFGDRLWVNVFQSSDRQTWGSGLSGWAKFLKAWVLTLDGGRPDPDTAARLTVTAGKIAGPEKWEKAVA